MHNNYMLHQNVASKNCSRIEHDETSVRTLMMREYESYLVRNQLMSMITD